jgi:DamX protein
MVTNQDSQQSTLFFTQERQQRLDLVMHLIPNSRQPILLRGPEAAGKSFFIGQFVKQVPKNWNVCALEAEELVISALDALDMAFKAVQQTDKSIQSRLSAWSSQEKVVVALIEDAHLLGSECFEQLFQLREEYSCLRLFFTSSENLGEDVEGRCQLIDLEPFTQKQTIAYAKERISSKGLGFVNLAGIDDVVLFIETGGLPGRINDVLDQMSTNPLQGERIKKPSNKLFIMSAVVVSIVLAIFLTYGLWDEKVIDEGFVLAIPSENNALSGEQFKKAQPTDIVKVQEIADVSPKPIMVKEKGNNAEVASEKEEKIKLPLVPSSEPPLPVVEKAVEQMDSSDVVNSIITPQEPDIKVVEELTKKTPLALHIEWITAQSPTRYTLQLMGASEEKSIKQYMASKKDVVGLRYFRHKKDSGAWYTVIYGEYAEKKLAETATKNLPKQLKNIKPWVRSFESVNKDLFQ